MVPSAMYCRVLVAMHYYGGVAGGEGQGERDGGGGGIHDCVYHGRQ